ncbi:coiled-coil domain-containing protein 137 [Salarias fasciatus]|uniref:Coiled-coil domain containing 137 n=1 Tax=Salarias fasciatus TaxID=181472 RepID=A0A672F404_SALFA|nr:coiled-coil domain-containing protein 137 [Salarias fasciatus]
MGKNKKNEASESGKKADKSGRQPSGKDKKKVTQRKKVTEEDHLNHIPFKLREILKSKETPKRSVKKKLQKGRPGGSKVGDIVVPRFKRRKEESEAAYVRRMENAAKHVLFLTKNQVDRKPELEEDQQERPAKAKSDRKREHDKDRLLKLQLKKLDKKETKMEKEMFVDSVAFGEVAMAPPSLSAKPKKAPIKPQKATKELLLNSLLGHTAVSTAKPSMARQRIMEEERERAVQAYRQLKKQRQLQHQVRAARPRKVQKS